MNEKMNEKANWPFDGSGRCYKADSYDFEELARRIQTTGLTTVSHKNKKNTKPTDRTADKPLTEAMTKDYEIEQEEMRIADEMEETYEKELVKYDNKHLQNIYDDLNAQGYSPTDSIVYAINNAELLNKPILIEGEPGVGKTSLAYAYAQACGMELIKVQFYSGITNSDLLYEYDYGKQMLYMNAIRENINAELKSLPAAEALKKMSAMGVDFFGREFLIERPLLKAITSPRRCCLLLDEIDKSEEDVEFMLLEILDKFSITIPEYGTISCDEDKKPMVFLTSNRYRELSDAMKRRCLYLYIEPKTMEETAEIIAKNTEVPRDFAFKVAEKVNEIRAFNLKQKPSISDSISWALVLFNTIGVDAFESRDINKTLGALLKNHSDIELVRRGCMV